MSRAPGAKTFEALVATLRRAIPGLTGSSVPASAPQAKGSIPIASTSGNAGSFTFADLERAISSARANRYLRSTADPSTGATDPVAAVALYEYNARLSTEAWSTIADVEVVLRNVIADALSAHHASIRSTATYRWYDGPSWFTTGRWFTDETMRSVKHAMKRVNDPGPGVGPRPGEGRVVAELTLGFWRYLLIARYEHSLWNPAIRAGFPALAHLSGSDSRKEVHQRIEKLNYLRNRVAHHEPIYQPFSIPGHASPIDSVLTLADAVELVSWNNSGAAAWIQARSSFASVAATMP